MENNFGDLKALDTNMGKYLKLRTFDTPVLQFVKRGRGIRERAGE